MKIAVAQINTMMGDIQYNLSRSILAYNQARLLGADVVVFPELTLTGYPPEDLLFREDFILAAEQAAEDFAKITTKCAAIIGTVIGVDHTLVGGVTPIAKCFNAAVICSDGKKQGHYYKQELPNYGVFDEKRNFIPGIVTNAHVLADIGVFEIAGKRVGVSICEDIWVGDPILKQIPHADVLVNLSASPYNAGRLLQREALIGSRAKEYHKPVVYANLVGGQDELVFDGASFAFNEDGEQVAAAPQFVEDLLFVDLDDGGNFASVLSPEEEVYTALVLGTRDYVSKNRFKKAIIGLSGGIDSAFVAAIAADALGPEKVLGVMMPSKFSSGGSITDALAVAKCLGIATIEIPIFGPHAILASVLDNAYAELYDDEIPEGNADENVQARIRGLMLMALSNKSGAMVLTTGNKSEMAVGYATLYGDMAGGFAVIKDVPKTMVFNLCNWLNEERGEMIPQTIIDKPPSAELRPDQKDTDSLPDYDTLDEIIERYVEQDQSPESIWAALQPDDPTLVNKVCRMIDLNEYKRRQAPPGIKITPKAFGRGRRLPIVNGWSHE